MAPSTLATGNIKLLFETLHPWPINVKLVWGKGERVFELVQGDVIADSGLYTGKIAVASREKLPREYRLTNDVPGSRNVRSKQEGWLAKI